MARKKHLVSLTPEYQSGGRSRQLEIVLNGTWTSWVMNLIFSYNVQPYQISEKRYYICIANIHKIVCIMSGDAIAIDLKLARYIRLAFKRFNMYI